MAWVVLLMLAIAALSVRTSITKSSGPTLVFSAYRLNHDWSSWVKGGFADLAPLRCGGLWILPAPRVKKDVVEDDCFDDPDETLRLQVRLEQVKLPGRRYTAGSCHAVRREALEARERQAEV